MTPRPPAPALSPLADVTDERFTDEQRARVARFDAAPVPPEVVVENVAVAIFRAHWQLDPSRILETEPLVWREHYRRLAAAAVAAMEGR